MKGMIKGSNYSGTSSNVSVLLHLLFMRKKKEREAERRKSELGGERGTRRTPGKRKAWIVAERAAAGLVIINSEKRIAVKARLPWRYPCMRACLRARARARGNADSN